MAVGFFAAPRATARATANADRTGSRGPVRCSSRFARIFLIFFP
jgi:hypothetical protein